ncbi:MAG: homocysteine S-methyltransferase family protein [Proteobacteria bacterium]|nr:homocysteine S-methyltransferase family protein [Pseudomonadota bacterium]
MSYDHVRKKLVSGEIIVLDGGTGTDIQRRGVAMSGETWCAEANLTHADVVRSVHDDYIAAGADVITANTFASSALLFNHLGRDADVPRVDSAALRAAKAAAYGKPVAVAGSMSTMRPMTNGSDRNQLTVTWPEEDARRLFRAKAAALRDAGADFIMMELLRDTDYAIWASEAALEVGLPVWIGLSCERGEDGALYGWGRPDCAFDRIASSLAALRPDVMSIMHTSPNDTGEAINILKKYWGGPIGTYPESGYFKSPDWVFVDVITPGDLVDKTREWQQQGATIFGGCCGIGPSHIEALSEAFKL